MSGTAQSLIVVDIGNSRIKLGLFESIGGPGLPQPTAALQLDSQRFDEGQIADWAGSISADRTDWWMATVFREAADRLVACVRDRIGGKPPREVRHADVPIRIAVEEPQRVGIDRVLGAFAAGLLKPAERGTVVVDLGTALKVTRVEPDGAFAGGAILPGVAMSARALHEQTALLPQIDMETLGEPPSPLGTSTVGAIRSGLYWGAVGSIRELVVRLDPDPDQGLPVYLTGGAAPAVARLLGDRYVHLPHLVLGGIAVVAAASQR